MREHDDRHVAFVAQGCQAFQQALPRIGGCLVATLECGVLAAVVVFDRQKIAGPRGLAGNT